MPGPDRLYRFVCVLALLAVPALAAPVAEPVDWEMVNRIRQEGLRNSQAMETLTELTEGIGPRLTGSPQMKRSNEWTRDKLAEWGLANAHLEPWGPFGRGWSFRRATAHMVAPYEQPLVVVPLAWTPGTPGPVRGPAMKAKLESEEDLEKLTGQVAGKILFVDDSRELMDATDPAFRRYGVEDLSQLEEFDLSGRRGAPDRNRREQFLKRFKLRKKLNEFLVAEQVLAVVEVSSRDAGLVRVGGGGSRQSDESPGVPRLVMALEHYNRVLRLLDRDQEVVLEVEVDARFHDDDEMAYNTLAEIPGSDKKSEVVMLGAHLDSWHAGTGATDNGAGVVVAMEAVRILQALGVKPRRTIRVALWSGEEQGLLGSRAYVSHHFASRPEPEDPEERDLPSFARRPTGPLTVKPDHAKVSTYFNLDNGSGKIRGIYAQENAAVVPIFEAWLAPFHDLGATTVTMNSTGGTDHLAFQGVGLPGFQFIQDQLDYFPRTHHTNADTLDHVVEEDLKQAAVVMASFVYHAAMRDQLLPRGPMPRDEPREGGPGAPATGLDLDHFDH
jgi:hypothetical protein